MLDKETAEEILHKVVHEGPQALGNDIIKYDHQIANRNLTIRKDFWSQPWTLNQHSISRKGLIEHINAYLEYHRNKEVIVHLQSFRMEIPANTSATDIELVKAKLPDIFRRKLAEGSILIEDVEDANDVSQ